MSDIRYVCMSDLHLGGETSMLTEARERDRLRPDAAYAGGGPVMRDLVACLRSLLGGIDGPKPDLILLGDALELALAQDQNAAATFQDFASLVMPPGDELFDEVWYVPGNHDHHLWEAARETVFGRYLEQLPASDPIRAPWHVTRMLEPRSATSPMLTSLLARARGGSAGKPSDAVWTTYPHLAIRHGEKCVVFHHGHLIESPYRALSMVDNWAFGADMPRHVWNLEADNFAWIDFLWSGLGRCGEAGGRVGYVFEHLQDEAGRRQLIDTLAGNLAKACPNKLPMQEVMKRVEDVGQGLTFHLLLELVAAFGMHLGRHEFEDGKRAEDAVDDAFRDYLADYVLDQLEHECPTDMPERVSFVFGHTHSPFEMAGVRVKGFGEPWEVLNTGGWVHESAKPQPNVGASLVLLDEGLEVTSVRLYNEGRTEQVSYPYVAQAAEGGDSELTWHVRRRIEGDPEPWERLVRTIDHEVARRCEWFAGTAG